MMTRFALLGRYAFAVALVAVATVLNIVLSGPLNGPTLMWPVTAITLAALLGGLRVGFAATALAALAHGYFVQEPRYSVLPLLRGDAWRLLLLVGVGGLMAFVAGSRQQALQRARAERARAEANASHLALSHALVTALARVQSLGEVSGAIFEKGFGAFGAGSLAISRWIEPDQVTVVAAFGFDSDAPPIGDSFSWTARLPQAEVIRSGRSVWLTSAEEVQRCYPDLRWGGAGAQALACVPFASEGRVVGAFCCRFLETRTFTDSEKDLLESLSATCGQALERARLFEAERVARVRAERAEAEAKRIGELQEKLVAVVSHDLRNPLAAAMNSVELLLRSPGMDERQHAALLRIRGSAARMERLVRDLLDFTRARRAFEIPTRSEPSDLQEIVRRSVAEFQASHPGTDIRVSAHGEQTGLWDPERIEQVVSNLVSNAVAHRAGSGAIWVRSCGTGSMVTLEVENQGEHIPAEALPTLFEAFKRGPGGNPGHLGLGLYIVREIVRAHNGSVSVRSTPGGLNTFTVELPRREVGVRATS